MVSLVPFGEMFWCTTSLCLAAQFCPTLCDLMDCSLPDLPVHEIFQARLLEWVAISFSRGSSQPRDRTCVSGIGKWSLYHWATWEVPPWVQVTYYTSYIWSKIALRSLKIVRLLPSAHEFVVNAFYCFCSDYLSLPDHQAWMQPQESLSQTPLSLA